MSEAAHHQEPHDESQRLRLRAGRISLAVGSAVFAGKLAAFFLTESAAIFSDAMESTINVVAAGMLLFALNLSARPPDRTHPYGHGKVEFFSAGIEGASIVVAACLIFVQAARELMLGSELHSLDLGLAVLVICSVANAFLGWHLVRTGKATESVALVADGRHVLTDVWTSAGVIGGLGVVMFTGWNWADPLIAMAVALNILREGSELVRESVRGLMDEVDEAQLESVSDALEAAREDSWIDVHSLRSWHSGPRKHIDMHMAVPSYYDVKQVHRIHDAIEEVLLDSDMHGGDVVVHFDPCAPHMCDMCRVEGCPIRKAVFRERPPFVIDRVTRDDAEAHQMLGAAASRGDAS